MILKSICINDRPSEKLKKKENDGMYEEKENVFNLHIFHSYLQIRIIDSSCSLYSFKSLIIYFFLLICNFSCGAVCSST